MEINENAIAAARKQGFVVHALPLDRYQPQVPYDVAVLSNVLEHSLDFQKMLHDIVRLLSAQGQLWISCPNSRSWMRPVFRRHWINWHVPFHIAHFNPLFLSEVLKNKGFRVKEFRCETPALWVAQSIIAWVFAKRGKPTRQLRSPVWVTGLILLVRCVFFPFLWLGNRLGRGDCLVIIAQKLA